ncbi:MAG: hypothetical protein MUF17_10050 [Syntrophales bacterium]|jgi:hypothetical protein|nr:hypothetical protein [Syntrophales bacterium]
MSRIREHGTCGIAAALILGLLALTACATAPQPAAQAASKEQVARISPQEAYPQVTAGKALLVCAYENEKNCSTIMLERAITLVEFQSRLAGLKKDQPIIFYCA